MCVRATLVLLVVSALLVPVPAGAGFAGTDVILPSVGHGPGAAGSQWYTTVWVSNLSTATATVTLSYFPRGQSNGAPQVATGQLGAGETARVDDVVGALFGLGNSFGALRVASDRSLLVSSRIYSQPPDGGPAESVGQFFGAVPTSFSIGAGGTTDLQGVFQYTPTQSSPFRYNFGFAEVAGDTVSVRVTARDPDGQQVASKVYSLGGFGVAQFPVNDLMPDIQAENLRLHLEVIAGGGRIVAFGSALANDSNDPSTFEMLFPGSLLGGGSGLGAVSHDGSLVGDGTTGAPLGIASGGVATGHLASGVVTTAKLSASGSSAGQVLTSDGAGVSWQTPAGGGGLSLPYAGSASSGSAIFAVTSQGGGPALLGQHAGTGNYTDVATGANALKAVAFSGNGVLAQSTQADGLRGESSADGKSGVYGTNQSADGYAIFGRNLAEGSFGFLGGPNGEGWSVGVLGNGGWGVDGRSGDFYGAGVRGYATGGAGIAVAGVATGANGIGVSGYSDQYLAGSFNGDVEITGSLSKGGGSFRIDHPLHPEERYLSHSFVESPDMMNVYNGNVELDASGRAWVELPGWFEALNRDFRYQLTAIGAPAPGLYVAREVVDNRFLIAGGAPGQRVSWQVTGIRHDPWAEAHRIVVEEDKPPEERGTLLHPDAYGLPPSRLPPRLRRMGSGPVY